MSRFHHDRAPLRRHMPSGAAFGIADHAVDQFRTRVAPGLTWAKARVELVILARSARKTDDYTGAGEEIWQATDGLPFLFVVARERDGRRVCVTVLHPDQDGLGRSQTPPGE